MMVSYFRIMAGCAAVGFGAASTLAAPTLTTLRQPDGNPLYPSCISGDGQIIYGFGSAGAFAWTLTGATPMDAPGDQPQIKATNRDGAFAVGSAEFSGLTLPLRWVNRVPSTLPTGGSEGEAIAISGDGQTIVGFTGPESGTNRAVSWTGDSMNYLDVGQDWTWSRATSASSDGSRILVIFQREPTGSSQYLALFTAEGVRELGAPMVSDFPPLFYRLVVYNNNVFVSDDGETVIARFSVPGSGAYEPFRWTETSNRWDVIPLPSGQGSFELAAINADASTIMGWMQEHQDFICYVWNQMTGWFRLTQFLIDNGLPPLYEPTGVTGISDDGLSICLHNGGQGYLLSMTGLPCPADFNHDDVVNFFDYLDFVSAFMSDLPSANFNRDALIDFFDYLDFVDQFSTGC